MSELSNQIDFKTILNKIFKSWTLILGLCVASLVVGALFYFLSENKYKHKTTVLLRNPLETERHQIYSQPSNYYQNIRNFADEDHIDEIMAITTTTDFYWAVISDLNLADVYGDKVEKIVRKNLEVKRSSNRDIEFTFVSAEKELGAKVVNYARDYVEKTYAVYFKELNQKKIEMLEWHNKELDSVINQLSDSIVAVKSTYQLAGALLPTRQSQALENAYSSVDINKAKGLEILQAIVRQKDKLVDDLANNQSLINQFKSSLSDDHRPLYFHVIQDGHPDKFEQVPNVVYLFVGIFLSSLFIGIIISLFRK